jgi:hypothetical protein
LCVRNAISSAAEVKNGLASRSNPSSRISISDADCSA